MLETYSTQLKLGLEDVFTAAFWTRFLFLVALSTTSPLPPGARWWQTPSFKGSLESGTMITINIYAFKSSPKTQMQHAFRKTLFFMWLSTNVWRRKCRAGSYHEQHVYPSGICWLPSVGCRIQFYCANIISVGLFRVVSVRWSCSRRQRTRNHHSLSVAGLSMVCLSAVNRVYVALVGGGNFQQIEKET